MTEFRPDPDDPPARGEAPPSGEEPAAAPPDVPADLPEGTSPAAAPPGPPARAGSASQGGLPASGPEGPPIPADATVGASDWNPLPARALPVFVAGELPFAVLLALMFGAAASVLTFVATSSLGRTFAQGLAGAILGLGWALWLSVRRFARTFWRLDAHGLSVREGRLWQREIRVPATRVQHLDLTRGPLQRGRDLATLVVHTAGSRHDAVTVPDLDAADAERLRDALSRQVDRDLDD